MPGRSPPGRHLYRRGVEPGGGAAVSPGAAPPPKVTRPRPHQPLARPVQVAQQEVGEAQRPGARHQRQHVRPAQEEEGSGDQRPVPRARAGGHDHQQGAGPVVGYGFSKNIKQAVRR